MFHFFFKSVTLYSLIVLYMCVLFFIVCFIWLLNGEIKCIFNGESDSSGVTDSCSGYGRPHTAHVTAKINKFKDLALVFYQCLLPMQTSSSVKKRILLHRPEPTFSYAHRVVFIFNGKISLLYVGRFYKSTPYIAEYGILGYLLPFLIQLLS